jgi:hypothetical protein
MRFDPDRAGDYPANFLFQKDGILRKTKACKQCGTVEPKSEYPFHLGMADGRTSTCKVCVKKRRIEIREERRQNHGESNNNGV